MDLRLKFDKFQFFEVRYYIFGAQNSVWSTAEAVLTKRVLWDCDHKVSHNVPYAQCIVHP